MHTPSYVGQGAIRSVINSLLPALSDSSSCSTNRERKYRRGPENQRAPTESCFTKAKSHFTRFEVRPAQLKDFRNALI